MPYLIKCVCVCVCVCKMFNQTAMLYKENWKNLLRNISWGPPTHFDKII